MKQAFDTVADQLPGIEQQVTELDLSVYNGGDDTSNYGNNIPASVLAEQGWLYKQYFDLFREEKNHISAVTIWGMADDDTWLDSFPVARTDYPLPFDMKLQAKPAYWGIIDPTHLPGYGLSFALSSKPTDHDARIWTITATNGDVGPAYDTLINGFTVHQIKGRPCTPTITTPGSFPISLGDIATSGSASASFTVDFHGCEPFARFALSVPWSSATYDTGTFVDQQEFHPSTPWNDRDGKNERGDRQDHGNKIDNPQAGPLPRPVPQHGPHSLLPIRLRVQSGHRLCSTVTHGEQNGSRAIWQPRAGAHRNACPW